MLWLTNFSQLTHRVPFLAGGYSDRRRLTHDWLVSATQLQGQGGNLYWLAQNTLRELIRTLSGFVIVERGRSSS